MNKKAWNIKKINYPASLLVSWTNSFYISFLCIITLYPLPALYQLCSRHCARVISFILKHGYYLQKPSVMVSSVCQPHVAVKVFYRCV